MFDIVILIGAICGPIMVVGSMILLYTGAISLKAASNSDDALKIEFIKEIKLTTRYPALGLFLIGFSFFLAAAWFAQKGDLDNLRLEGKIESPDELVNIELHLRAGPWKQNLTDDRGVISAIFHPSTSKLTVEIVAPGYKKSGITRDLVVKSGLADLGSIDIGPRTIDNIEPGENIPPRQSIPAGESSVSYEGAY